MITTYEEACDIIGIEPMVDKEMVLSGFLIREIALRKLIAIIYVLNERWMPTWNELPSPKYHPIFIKDSFNTKDLLTFTGVIQSYSKIQNHPDLLFKNVALAEYAGKTFLRLYEQLYLNK